LRALSDPEILISAFGAAGLPMERIGSRPIRSRLGCTKG
jgi:hypothetical protein